MVDLACEDKGGIYLYRATIPVNLLDKARPIQQEKNTIDYSSILAIVGTGLAALGGVLVDVAAKSLSKSDPNSAARNLFATQMNAHQSLVVEGNLGFAHTARRSISLDCLHKKNQRGDLITAQLALGASSGSAYSQSNVWIVSTHSPEIVTQQQKMDEKNSHVFFSQEDAETFIAAFKKQTPLIHAPSLLGLGENSTKDRETIKKLLDKLYDDFLKESPHSLKDKVTAESTLEVLLLKTTSRLKATRDPVNDLSLQDHLTHLERYLKTMTRDDPTLHFSATKLAVQTLEEAAKQRNINIKDIIKEQKSSISTPQQERKNLPS